MSRACFPTPMPVGAGPATVPAATIASLMRTFLVVFSLCGASFAQTAAFVPFGLGCAFQGQTLSIGNQGLPRLGTTFQVTYAGPNFTFSSGQQIAHPILVLGLGQQLVPLPTSLLPQQPPGCTAYITTDVFLPTVPDPTRAAFTSWVDIAVPNTPTLVGLVFNAQWMALVEQCGFAGCGFAAVPTSDAAVVVVGT